MPTFENKITAILNSMNISFFNFIERLKINLGKPLPGLEVQYQMAPVTKMEQLVYNHNDSPPKESSVLVLLYPEAKETMLVIMKRAVDHSVHSGQLSFPGGQAEPFDKDVVATALRETNEELGIDSNLVHVLGTLTPVYISPSNFNVIPVVGYMDVKPVFSINEEVEKVFSVAVSELMKPDAKKIRQVTTRYVTRLEVPCYMVEGEILWGATAMMIRELMELLKSN
jgi:8-oxo-dGTP pyrophosphatase MutT (NUDIX family)